MLDFLLMTRYTVCMNRKGNEMIRWNVTVTEKVDHDLAGRPAEIVKTYSSSAGVPHEHLLEFYDGAMILALDSEVIPYTGPDPEGTEVSVSLFGDFENIIQKDLVDMAADGCWISPEEYWFARGVGVPTGLTGFEVVE